MGVKLRGRKMGMAQKLLDAAQVSAGVEEVRRVTVPQLVRREARVQTGERQIFFEAARQVYRTDRPRLFLLHHENRRSPRRQLPQRAPVSLDGGQGRRAYRHQALLASLAAHAHELVVPIKVV